MLEQFNSISGARRSLHVQVAREIARSILSREIVEGEIIPSEFSLCEQFGVSRTALREAIKLLTSKGLLESRPKIGTRVATQDKWNMLDSQLIEWMDGLVNGSLFYSQFLELRRAIEPEACALAALSATAEQRIELSEIFQRMTAIATANTFDDAAWTEADLSFHRLIFIATDNRFYLPFGNILSTVYINFIGFSSQDGSTCLKEHQKIYDAIMAGKAEEAKQASLDHLQGSKHNLS